MMSVSIGADPELFVVDMNSRRFISSVGKFGGTKDTPKPIGQNCFIQEDNVAVEFNIPPSKSKEEFLKSINYSLETIAQRAKELDLVVDLSATAVFDNGELLSDQAKVFGCDPDFNAWTQTKNPAPRAKNKNLRSAGGHVHVGCKDFGGFEIARTLDLFLGIPSVILDPNNERRELYGKAGACREKPYGVEYRVLSNFWLKAPKFQEWVYTRTHEAIEFLQTGNQLNFDDGQIIQEAINTSNMTLATKTLERYGLGLGTTL